MSFAGYQFLFEFLPLALAAIWFATAVGGRHLFVPAIVATSAAFYAFSSIPHLLLLVILVAATWAISRVFFRYRDHSAAVWLIRFGVIFNLSALSIWKYGDSLVATYNALTPFHANPPSLLLPLGISFYSLQQIGFLLDLEKGRAKISGPLEYAGFVMFFPQLLAGPIVRQRRMSVEFDRVRSGIEFDERVRMACIGFAWIASGLFKKTVFADSLARLTDPDIIAAYSGSIGTFEAWRLLLASPLRIYFDFSGYSDMAVGLALLCGVRLPYNFDAPFRVSNFREGWRHWHITFHHFIRDHVYGPLRRRLSGVPHGTIIAILVSVMLSALWHVDNLQFLLWGLGLFVFILIGMRLRFKPGERAWFYIGIEVILSGVIAVVFVAPDGSTAATILLAAVGVADSLFVHSRDWAADVLSLFWVPALYALAKTEISTQTLIGSPKDHPRRTFFGYAPPEFSLTPGWAAYFAVLFLTGIWFAGYSEPFIYFQF
jgi:D-alanyl-lipoteichoic acid acyltransferase DltB (MBOAT superfamily)